MRIRSAVSLRMKRLCKISRRRRRQSSVAVALLLCPLPDDTEFVSQYHFSSGTVLPPDGDCKGDEAFDLFAAESLTPVA